MTPCTEAPPGSCPWNSPGKNTRVGCHFPLQGIFPTQGWNPIKSLKNNILPCPPHSQLLFQSLLHSWRFLLPSLPLHCGAKGGQLVRGSEQEASELKTVSPPPIPTKDDSQGRPAPRGVLFQMQGSLENTPRDWLRTAAPGSPLLQGGEKRLPGSEQRYPPSVRARAKCFARELCAFTLVLLAPRTSHLDYVYNLSFLTITGGLKKVKCPARVYVLSRSVVSDSL